MKYNSKLHKLYYQLDSPVALGGLNKFCTEAKKLYGINRKECETWLSSQDAYTLHKPARKRFKRVRYQLLAIDDIWQADLCVMASLAKWNDHVAYLLVVIDCFSKFVWVKPLRSKTADAVHAAMESMLVELRPRKPTNFMTDHGGEFVNRKVKQLMKIHHINFYTARNPDTKSSIVERVIRTLKGRLYRFMTASNSQRYVDDLQKLVAQYNNSYHSTIGMRPNEVTVDVEDELRKRLNSHFLVSAKPNKITVGDYVRISKYRQVFGKGYLPNWTEEIFKVSTVITSNPKRFKLVDYSNDEVIGTFYREELQKVKQPEFYKVEKVLRYRNKKKEALVKWLGYPRAMASWIKASELRRL